MFMDDGHYAFTEFHDGADLSAFARTFRIMASKRKFTPTALLAPESTETRRRLLRGPARVPSPFQASFYLPGDRRGFGIELLITAPDGRTKATIPSVAAAVGRVGPGDADTAPPWPVDAQTFEPDLLVNPVDISSMSAEAVGLRMFGALVAVGAHPTTGRWQGTWQCSRDVWPR